MFCTNCGAQIGENEKFCTNCGARQAVEEAVEQMANAGAGIEAGAQMAEVAGEAAAPAVTMEADVQEEITGNFQQTMHTDMEVPKKKKRFKKKAIIAAVVAGSLVVTSGLAALVSPTVRNTFARTFMSEQKYFEHVQKKNAKKVAESFAAALNAYEKLLAGNSVAEGNAEFILEKEGMQFIAEKGGAEVASVLGQIQDMSIRYGIEGNAKGFALDGSYNVNGTTLLNAEVIADMEGGNLYVRFPGMSSKTLRLNFSEEMDMRAYEEGMGMIKKILEIMPEQDVLERMITRYWEAIATSVTGVDESSVTLTAGGVSQKCVQQKIKINEKLVLKVAKAVLGEAKSDSDLKEIIMDTANAVGGNAESTYEEFKTGVEMALKGLSSANAGSESLGNLKIWVNGEGDIIGIGFDAEDGELAVYTLEKGNKFASVAKFEADGKKVAIEGSGTVSGGKRSGSLKLNVLGAEYVEISFADIDEAKLEKGWFDGKITIAPTASATALMKAAAPGEAAELLDGLKLEISGTQNSEFEAEGAMTFYMANRRFMTWKADARIADRAFQLPDPSGRFVDATNQEDMMDWGEDCMNAIKENMQSAGIHIEEESETELEIAQGIENNMPQEFGIGRVIQ